MVTTLSAREKVADFFPGAQLPQMHHNINKINKSEDIIRGLEIVASLV